MGQEHARVRSGAQQELAGAVQEQDRSTLFLSFASISPHAIFHGQKQSRSRAGARQDQGRSRVRGEQEKGRSKAGARAGKEQEPNYKISSMFGVKHKVERFHHWSVLVLVL